MRVPTEPMLDKRYQHVARNPHVTRARLPAGDGTQPANVLLSAHDTLRVTQHATSTHACTHAALAVEYD